MADFNNFYISGNGNECPLRVSYLLIYYACDVNMMSMSRIYDIHELRQHPLGVWRGLEQSVIDGLFFLLFFLA